MTFEFPEGDDALLKGGGICYRFDDLGADGAPCHLGVFGGTFDPIHMGHLALAEQSRDAFGLDSVIFVPTSQPQYKDHQPILGPMDRLAMCRLATADNPCFDVSPADIRRGGATYTVDTLREFRAHFPENVRLSFIVGADAAQMIPTWHESSSLGELAEFIAVTRPGYALDCYAADALGEMEGFNVHRLRISGLAISSSDVRARIQEGRTIRYLVPECIRGYIEDRELYE